MNNLRLVGFLTLAALAAAASSCTIERTLPPTAVLRCTIGTSCPPGYACTADRYCLRVATDIAAPSLDAFTPASPSNRDAVTVSGTAPAGAIVRLYRSGDCSDDLAASGEAEASGAFRITATVPHNKETIFRATAQLGATVSGCSTKSLAFVHDDQPPAPPVLVAASPRSPSTTTTPRISGTSTPGTTVALYAAADCSGSPLATGPVDEAGAFDVQISVARGATTTIYGSAKDRAENVSACSTTSLRFVNDSERPDPPTLVSVTPYSPANDNLPRLRGTAEAGARITVYGVAGCTGTPLAEGDAETFIDSGLYIVVDDDTTTTFYADATDTAGNTSDCSAAGLEYIEDSTQPDPPAALATQPASPGNAAEPLVRGVAEPGSLVRLYLTAGCAGAPAAAGIAATFADPGLAVAVTRNATTTVRAVAVDAAGNASRCSDGVAYLHDDVPPAAPTNVTTSPASPSSSTTVALSGVAEAGTTVSLYETAACAGAPLRSGILPSELAAGIALSVPADTPRSFSVSAQDAAGNVSPCSTTVTYVADTSPPAFAGPVSATALSTSSLRVTWAPASDAGTPEAELVYEVCAATVRRSDGGCDPFVVARSVTGATSADLEGLQPGVRYYVAVRARDLLGRNDTNTAEVTARTFGPGAVRDLAVGRFHNCAIMVDGSVRCWGLNDQGQLGYSAGTNQLRPRAVPGLPPVRAIAAGNKHTCALLPNGALSCWGGNANGQLGDGTIVDRHTPTPVPGIGGVVSVAAGSSFTCALHADRRVSCLGGNPYGQLGTGNNLPSPTAVAVSGVDGAVELAAGDDHACALLRRGEVRCWGRNDGQLGDGTTTARSTPTPVIALPGPAIALSAGSAHTCALLTSGELRCWGVGTPGRLGDGAAETRTTPVRVQLAPGQRAVALTAGSSFTCAQLSDAGPRCWGSNTSGQLGIGGGDHQTVPATVVGLPPARSLRAGASHACAHLVDGTVRCWGEGVYGSLGDGTVANRNIPTPAVDLGGPVGVVRLATGGSHACVVLSSGELRCWGSNANGQLGYSGGSTPLPRNGPALAGVRSLNLVARITCALQTSGETRCWGENANGQLGDGTTTPSTTPVMVPSLPPALDVVGSITHTCALLAGGSAACWGKNDLGDLGDGTRTSRLTQAPVLGFDNAIAISVISSHGCVVLDDGRVTCWGKNDLGQVGDGTQTSPRPTPLAVPGFGAGAMLATAVSVGDLHTCALTADGKVYCWGVVLGGNRLAPMLVPDLPPALALTAHGRHTCALLGDGTVKCWGGVGGNANGQLGDGTTTDSPTPVAVLGLSNVISIRATHDGNCALLADGTVKCWGRNLSGTVGDGTFVTPRLSPGPVLELP